MIVCFSGISYFATQKVSAVPSKEFCVVIDAGHGGIDGGSVGKLGVFERDLNLKVAKKLEGFLTALNIKVVQTRQTQQGLYSVFASGFKKKDMKERQKIIQNSNADLVVSIHMNFFSDSKSCGAQAFYKQNSPQSKMLASFMQELFIKNLYNARKAPLSGDFYILNCTEKPGVLIECGYLSNEEEEKLLISDEYEQKVAYQIFCGIVKFLGINNSANN
ncbi:MAG: N-acetylmuramoyl-L-alanine amidase [Clostridia bacterium]|nr:N-acetylmuramoyl-L-alanine amidase [Clostridia bacterium]